MIHHPADPGSATPPPYFGRSPSKLGCAVVVAGAVVLGIFVVAGSVWGLGCAMRWIGGH